MEKKRRHSHKTLTVRWRRISFYVLYALSSDRVGVCIHCFARSRANKNRIINVVVHGRSPIILKRVLTFSRTSRNEFRTSIINTLSLRSVRRANAAIKIGRFSRGITDEVTHFHHLQNNNNNNKPKSL